MQDELERVYTVREVATALSVTPITVLHMIQDGRLKAAKLGNRWRIRAVDVTAFLTQHTDIREGA